MSVSFLTFAERADLVERYLAMPDDVWPAHMEFINHDPVCNEFWPRLKLDFPQFQFFAHDAGLDEILAYGNCLPIRWSGRDEDLPAGVPAVLQAGFAELSRGVEPTALCALLAAVRPIARSRGLSSQMLLYMKELAAGGGLDWLIAPVRPNLKEQYPLTPIERYAAWRRDDGLLLDPWLRTHERLGARYAGIAPQGNVFRGSVGDWQQWTGMALPETGDYVVHGALSPLRIDHEADEGVLVEPNVWMVHVASSG
jgi:GNAT superfamily N-acetyltransferase